MKTEVRFNAHKPHEYLIPHRDFFIWCNGPQEHTQFNLPAIHSHNGWYELVIVVSGSALHITSSGNEESSCVVKSGNFFLVPPGNKHYYEDSQDFVIYNILFQEWFLNAFKHDLLKLPQGSLIFMKNAPPGNVPISQISNIIAQCNAVWEIADNPSQAGGKLKMAALVLDLLLTLCNSHDHEIGSDSSFHTAYTVSRIVDYLDNHLDKDISLAELAARYSMSLSVFRKKFKSVTGISAIDYLTMLRMRRAMLLLIERNMPISQVANASGFSDSNFFSRQFHKKLGLTPRDFLHLPSEQQQEMLKKHIPTFQK